MNLAETIIRLTSEGVGLHFTGDGPVVRCELSRNDRKLSIFVSRDTVADRGLDTLAREIERTVSQFLPPG